MQGNKFSAGKECFRFYRWANRCAYRKIKPEHIGDAVHPGSDGTECVEMVVDRSKKYELEYWKIWGLCFEVVICLERGQTKAGIDLLRSGFARLTILQRMMSALDTPLRLAGIGVAIPPA
jgi:hypothetical protein